MADHHTLLSVLFPVGAAGNDAPGDADIENGVSDHEGGSLDGIGYAVDLDHVATAEREP